MQGANLDPGRLTTLRRAALILALLYCTKAEGVGEIPEAPSPAAYLCRRLRAGFDPSLNFMGPALTVRDSVKLELPVSPTPLPSTGAGVSSAIA